MIDFAAERAVYRQIADQLRAQIRAGDIPPGGLLPSEGRLAQQYGVGKDTVQRAIAVLRNEGIVGTERGYGTWVVEEKARTQVRVPRGAEVEVRMPDDAERVELDIEAGVVVPIVVITMGGLLRGKYAADRVRLTFN